MKLQKIILISMLPIIASSALAGQNWTNRFGGDASHTGYVNIKTDPKNFHLLWTKAIKLDFSADKHPSAKWERMDAIIVDRTIYVTKTEFYDERRDSLKEVIYPYSGLIALDTTTGQTKYQKLIDGNAETSAPLYDGDGRVLIAVDNDNDKYIFTYLTNGNLDYTVPCQGYSFDGPVAFHGNYYSQAGGKLESYNTKTGKLNWVHDLNLHDDAPHQITVSDKYVIQDNSDRTIDVFDTKSGKRLFSYFVADGWEDQPYRKVPVYDEKNETIYVSMRNTRKGDGYVSIFAYDLKTQKLKWKSPYQLFQPVLADDEIYVVGEGADPASGNLIEELHVVDVKSGETKWTWQSPSDFSLFNQFNTMVATQDLIFIPGKTKTIALSRKTHEIAWEIARTGRLSIADNKLFISGYSGSPSKMTITAISLA